MDFIARNGWRYNKSRAKQRWKCAKCNIRFTEDDGFWKMKNTPETVTEAIDLYETGHSLEQTKEHLWNRHSIKISETSIKNWVKKYSRRIETYTDTLSPKVKARIHEDEVELRVNGRKIFFLACKGIQIRIQVLRSRGQKNHGKLPILKPPDKDKML